MQLRTVRSETSLQLDNTDRFFELWQAVVLRAWADMQLPCRQPGGNTTLPTQAEQRQAWEFLCELMDSAHHIGDVEKPSHVGLDACQSDRLARQRHLAWRREVQEAWALLAAHQG